MIINKFKMNKYTFYMIWVCFKIYHKYLSPGKMWTGHLILYINRACLIHVLQFWFLSLKRQALYISFYKHLFSIDSLFLFFLKITLKYTKHYKLTSILKQTQVTKGLYISYELGFFCYLFKNKYRYKCLNIYFEIISNFLWNSRNLLQHLNTSYINKQKKHLQFKTHRCQLWWTGPILE